MFIEVCILSAGLKRLMKLLKKPGKSKNIKFRLNRTLADCAWLKTLNAFHWICLKIGMKLEVHFAEHAQKKGRLQMLLRCIYM